MKTRTLIAAALLVAGCGPVLIGSGDAVKLDGAFTVCREETIGYALVPDFGISGQIARDSCMREFGWQRTENTFRGWQWVGR